MRLVTANAPRWVFTVSYSMRANGIILECKKFNKNYSIRACLQGKMSVSNSVTVGIFPNQFTLSLFILLILSKCLIGRKLYLVYSLLSSLGFFTLFCFLYYYATTKKTKLFYKFYSFCKFIPFSLHSSFGVVYIYRHYFWVEV